LGLGESTPTTTTRQAGEGEGATHHAKQPVRN
jgi:hypothetical protein